MNEFKGFLFPCPEKGIGGIDGIWCIDRGYINAFYYSPETSNPDTIIPFPFYKSLHYGIISGIDIAIKPATAVPYKWTQLDVDNSASELTQKLNRNGEDSYDMELSMQTNEYNTFSRDAIEMLATVRSVCFIILDANGRYWLIGETEGCDILFNTTTGKDGGTNVITMNAACKERSPVRMVSNAYISANVTIAQTYMTQTQFDLYNSFMNTPVNSKPNQLQ